MTSYAVPGSAGTTAPGGPSGLVRLVALCFWVLLPLVALTGVVVGVVTWAGESDNRPAGIPGVYRVDNRSCDGGICFQTGSFTSDDGSLTVAPVTGYSGWTAGTSHLVVYDPSDPFQIVQLPGRWNPTATITALVGSVGLLAVWTWFGFGARRHP